MDLNTRIRGQRLMREILDCASMMPVEDIHGDGTSAKHTKALRITRQSLQHHRDKGDVTYLLTAKVALAEAAVCGPDNPGLLRLQLIHLAASVVSWIDDIDQRQE